MKTPLLSIHDGGQGFDWRRECAVESFAVDSAPGQGTTLQVSLPLPVSAPQPAREMA